MKFVLISKWHIKILWQIEGVQDCRTISLFQSAILPRIMNDWPLGLLFCLIVLEFSVLPDCL